MQHVPMLDGVDPGCLVGQVVHARLEPPLGCVAVEVEVTEREHALCRTKPDHDLGNAGHKHAEREPAQDGPAPSLDEFHAGHALRRPRPSAQL